MSFLFFTGGRPPGLPLPPRTIFRLRKRYVSYSTSIQKKLQLFGIFCIHEILWVNWWNPPVFEASLDFWPKHTYPLFGYRGRRHGIRLKRKLRKKKEKNPRNVWLPEQHASSRRVTPACFFATNEVPEELGIHYFFCNPPQNFARGARSINRVRVFTQNLWTFSIHYSTILMAAKSTAFLVEGPLWKESILRVSGLIPDLIPVMSSFELISEHEFGVVLTASVA